MLTIFSLPKPFEGIYNFIQRNAIRSWTLLGLRPEIILCEDEKGTTKKISKEFGTVYIAKIEKNESEIPLVSDIFEKAQKIAKNDILAYVNADIILTSSFMRAVELIKNEKDFLMVGQRWDLDLKEKINFQNPNWEEDLKKEVLKKGKLHPKTGIDYFVFKKGFFKEIPPFALGRTVWDEWLLYDSWRRRAKIIDATQVTMVIHQNHPYLTRENQIFNPWKSKEAKRNLKLAGGYRHCFTIADATHILTPEGIKQAPKMSFIRKLEILPYLGFFVRKRKRLNRLIKK